MTDNFRKDWRLGKPGAVADSKIVEKPEASGP
jgi:hypothetical protein